MKNYVSPGTSVTIAAPYDLKSGDPVFTGTAYGVEGSLFGVAADDAASGEPVVLVLTGVFELPKVAGDSVAIGGTLLWDSTAKKLTTTGIGKPAVGPAMSTALAGSTTVLVRLR